MAAHRLGGRRVRPCTATAPTARRRNARASPAPASSRPRARTAREPVTKKPARAGRAWRAGRRSAPGGSWRASVHGGLPVGASPFSVERRPAARRTAASARPPAPGRPPTCCASERVEHEADDQHERRASPTTAAVAPRCRRTGPGVGSVAASRRLLRSRDRAAAPRASRSRPPAVSRHASASPPPRQPHAAARRGTAADAPSRAPSRAARPARAPPAARAARRAARRSGRHVTIPKSRSIGCPRRSARAKPAIAVTPEASTAAPVER